jgi:hypothetical protein
MMVDINCPHNPLTSQGKRAVCKKRRAHGPPVRANPHCAWRALARQQHTGEALPSRKQWVQLVTFRWPLSALTGYT